jgi:hypothetical protein
MDALTVHCDDCEWEETMSRLRHLRAWYRVACPECGCGELIDATEVRVVEELIALEGEGLIALHHPGDALEDGKVVMRLNTANPRLFTSAE